MKICLYKYMVCILIGIDSIFIVVFVIIWMWFNRELLEVMKNVKIYIYV